MDGARRIGVHVDEGARPLTEGERQWLISIRVRVKKRLHTLQIWLVATTVAMVGHLIAAGFDLELIGTTLAASFMISMVVFCATTGVAVVGIPKLHRQLRRIDGDLDRGEVNLYTSGADGHEITLAASGHVLMPDFPTRYELKIEPVLLAGRPTRAFGFPVLVRDVGEARPTFSRPMSADEKAEIQRYLKSHRSINRSIRTSVLAGYCGIQVLRPFWVHDFATYVVALVFLPLLYLAVVGPAREALINARLRRDIKVGEIRWFDSIDGEIEYLPASTALWSVGEEACPWRWSADIRNVDR